MNSEITVGIVTFNSANDIEECINSIPQDQIDIVIVADNASSDNTVQLVKSLSSNSDYEIELVELDANYGFGVGCNKVIENAKTEYVLLLNPDVRLKPNSIEELHKGFSSESVGVCVPKILKDGEVQFSLRRFPTPLRTFFESIFGGSILKKLNRSEIISEHASYLKSHSVDWATGACWLIKKSTVENVGKFSSKWFLYSEETELAKKVSYAGYEMRYNNNAVVEHRAGAQHTNRYLYTLAQANKLEYLQDLRGKKLFWVYLAFLMGFALRSHKEVARFAFLSFIKNGNDMAKLRSQLIQGLGGTVE